VAKLTVLIWGNFGKLSFKRSCAFPSLLTDQVDGMSRLTHLVNVRGVIYQFLNIGRQITNRWIHQGGKITFNIRVRITLH
jgi:hypothetical protein